MVLISIEGNIGAGKSRVLRALQTQGYSVLFEKIEDWPLEDFYKDPSRWGLVMQLAIVRSYFQTEVSGPLVIQERSLTSALAVFWQRQVDTGTVTTLEDSLLWFFVDDRVTVPDVTIYLDVPPEVCLQNISTRGQRGDDKVTLEYLREIDTYYKGLEKTHIVDGTGDPETVAKCVKLIIDSYK